MGARQKAAILAAIALAGLLSHLPLAESEFVQDDHLAVEGNAIVERGDLREILGSSYWEGAQGNDRRLYRPLPILTYSIERRFTGEPDALLAHGVNVAIHLLVCCALFLLARALGGTPLAAGSAAAIFAVHPVHVEAVANIVGRAELLAALFSIVCLRLQIVALSTVRSLALRRVAAWSAGLALLLALCSKEVAAAVPLLTLALVVMLPSEVPRFGKSWWLRTAGVLGPVVLASLAYLVMRVNALEVLFSLQSAHPIDNRLVDLDGLPRIATALGLLARYAMLLVFPARLSADYSGGVIAVEPTLFGLLPLAGLLLLVSLAAPPLAWLVGGRRSPLVVRGALYALLFLLPYLIIGNLLLIVGSIFAERFLYLPSAGFCLLLGLLIGELASRLELRNLSRTARLIPLVVVVVAVVALGARTWVRCLDWRDDTSLFAAAAETCPESPRAHFVLGRMAMSRGEPAAAIPHFDRTIEIFPGHSTAWLEKGNALGELGDLVEAERMFRKSLEIAPNYAVVHLNLAIALRGQHRLAEAERALRHALQWDRSSVKAWTELGNLFLETRRYLPAIRAYRRATALGRDDLAERIAIAERGLAAEG